MQDHVTFSATFGFPLINGGAYILTMNNYGIPEFPLIFDDISLLYQMVTKNVRYYNDKYRTLCTGTKLAHYWVGCTSELEEKL